MAFIEKRFAKDGKTTYRVRVRLKGSPEQNATFDRLTDAKRWAQSTEAAIREGRHFKNAESKKHTLADLVNRYIEHVLPTKPKQIKDQTYQLKWWQEHLGSHVLADITPALIAERRDMLGRSRSPATVVRYMAALSHAFSIARDEWGWLEDSPMRKVRKPRESNGRVRFLDEDERVRLLKACKDSSNAWLYLVVVLALSTGMRLGEIMRLYWRRPSKPPENVAWGVVHLGQDAIVLYDTKNTDHRRIPLSGHALDQLTEHAKTRRLDTDLLFPGKTDGLKPIDLRKPWETALKTAQIEDFRFHDLRHSAASYLAMNGASLAEIAEVLGHKTLQMVKRYAHLSEAHTSRVVASMNAKIFSDP